MYNLITQHYNSKQIVYVFRIVNLEAWMFYINILPIMEYGNKYLLQL